MIPAIAVMIAAYAIPRLFIDALRFSLEFRDLNDTPHRFGRVVIWLGVVGAIGVIVLSLMGVMAAGVRMSDLPALR